MSTAATEGVQHFLTKYAAFTTIFTTTITITSTILIKMYFGDFPAFTLLIAGFSIHSALILKFERHFSLFIPGALITVAISGNMYGTKYPNGSWNRTDPMFGFSRTLFPFLSNISAPRRMRELALKAAPAGSQCMLSNNFANSKFSTTDSYDRKGFPTMVMVPPTCLYTGAKRVPAHKTTTELGPFTEFYTVGSVAVSVMAINVMEFEGCFQRQLVCLGFGWMLASFVYYTYECNKKVMSLERDNHDIGQERKGIMLDIAHKKAQSENSWAQDDVNRAYFNTTATRQQIAEHKAASSEHNLTIANANRDLQPNECYSLVGELIKNAGIPTHWTCYQQREYLLLSSFLACKTLMAADIMFEEYWTPDAATRRDFLAGPMSDYWIFAHVVFADFWWVFFLSVWVWRKFRTQSPPVVPQSPSVVHQVVYPVVQAHVVSGNADSETFPIANANLVKRTRSRGGGGLRSPRVTRSVTQLHEL
jgi:hypothetical protein